MKSFVAIGISVLITTCCLAQKNKTDTLENRIILVGDAGALVNGRAVVLDAIKKKYAFDKKTTIVFLGDNLYDVGLPDELSAGYDLQKAALDSQVNIAKGTDAMIYMMPGNHDWDRGGIYGDEAIIRQQHYVDYYSGAKNVKFYPEDGCPGPVEVSLSKDVVLIIMDSEWWIHPYKKPGVESDCDTKTIEEVLSELDDLLNKNYKKLVLFACHHPFMSNGIHGGYFTIKQHIFPFTDLRKNLFIPLPIIGSIYPITRSVFGTAQDIIHPDYQNMINKVNNVLKNHPHVIRVHGHEHNLQYIRNDSITQIISGAGCKMTRVSHGRDAKYLAQKLGFCVLDITYDKKVWATFYEVDPDNIDSTKIGFRDTIADFSKLPVIPKQDSVKAIPIVWDKLVLASASEKYNKASGLKRFLDGNNYRKEWSTKVAFKVFNINKEKGGFKIEGVGGGKQTKSMKLIDKDGREWTLRTIDKDPELAMPPELRGSVAQELVQDMISASHPYAPLIVPPMADAAGISAAHPEFFYVPDDRSFGYYRPWFANKICLLEIKEGYDVKDNKSTYKLFNKMRDDNDQTVDERAVLKARLLDMLIADWDRHFDQWRWVPGDTGKGKIFRPFPRDRDQALFNSDGLLIKIMGGKLPFLRGLKANFPKAIDFNWEARDLDRLFLNHLNENDWKEVTAEFVEKVNDSVIRNAVKQMPPEIYAIRGKEITDKILGRRKVLQERAMQYYKFISKRVQVLGSNANEFFHLSSVNDSLKIEVYAYDKGKDTSFLMYRRIFDQRATKFIHLWGFGGNDIFLVDSNVNAKIKLRIIGGRGDDTFRIKGNITNYIYDNTGEKNVVEKGKRTHDMFASTPEVNNYEIQNFKYNQLKLPRLALGYNPADGLLVGTGFSLRTYGFRKEPFASDQSFTALFALTEKAYQFTYTGEFVNVLHKTNVVINAREVSTSLNNFFGFGNETTVNKDIRVKYYRTRYHFAEADLLLKRKAFNIMSFSFGPSVFHYWIHDYNNTNYVLGKPSLVGLDSLSIYKTKTHVGGKFIIDIDNLGNPLYPIRGISWKTWFTSLYSVDKKSTPVNKLETNMVVYASRRNNPRLTTVIRAGGGYIFEKKFEYYQAVSLGANDYLRGFRKNRFSGKSVAYGSIEFRIKLLENRSYLLPGPIGILTFGDIGRVWFPGENSSKWHGAYGGGFFFVPFNKAILSVAAAKSGEELLFNISLGTKFNLTF